MNPSIREKPFHAKRGSDSIQRLIIQTRSGSYHTRGRHFGIQAGFQVLGGRTVVGAFDGGHISSDGGALLLREVDVRLGITRRLATCFTDHRRQEFVEHSVLELVRQRVYGLALGYEDLNDHDELSLDPLLALAVGKRDPEGARHYALLTPEA